MASWPHGLMAQKFQGLCYCLTIVEYSRLQWIPEVDIISLCLSSISLGTDWVVKCKLRQRSGVCKGHQRRSI
jgi:hypothetical protein